VAINRFLIRRAFVIRRAFEYFFQTKSVSPELLPRPIGEFISQTLEHPGFYEAYGEIEALRAELLASRRKFKALDLGAGSKAMQGSLRSVAKVAQVAAVKPKYGQLLFRLANRFEPRTLLELGTSLGIGTLYLAKANPDAQIHSLEGCPETAKIALENFEKMGIHNIQVHIGDFGEQLPKILDKLSNLDFVFVDGNHQKEPTIQYFEQCLIKSTTKTIFIFDDIHWSEGMEEAWHNIQNHPQVCTSLDVFQFGIVFLDPEMRPGHWTIRY